LENPDNNSSEKNEDDHFAPTWQALPATLNAVRDKFQNPFKDFSNKITDQGSSPLMTATNSPVLV